MTASNSVPKALVNYSQAPGAGGYAVSDSTAFSTLRQDFPLADYPGMTDTALQQLIDQADSSHTGMLSGKDIDALVAELVQMLEHGGESSPQILGQIASLLGLTPPSDAAPATPQQQQSAENAAKNAINQGQQTNDSNARGGAPVSSSGPGASSQQGSAGNPTAGGDGKTGPIQGTDGTPINSSTATQDGYTVQDCFNDMKKLTKAASEGGAAGVSDDQLMTIAQGIIQGVNQDFPGVKDGKAMAQTLIASAYKESKFGAAGRDGGGVFQCAPNRFQDYLAAHGGKAPPGINSYADMSDPKNMAASIQVSLWAMAHPAQGLGPTGGVNPPTTPEGQALYYWNYNPGELADYMAKTTEFVNDMNS